MQNNELMQTFVIDLLQVDIPPAYCYHNYEHTLYVQDRVKTIAEHENCSKEEIRLLNAAALWHDTGFIETYNGHEEVSCLLAQKYLPKYGFSDSEIVTICGMIMATKLPQTPTNKLEEILSDADLAYLGTLGATEKAECLFEELQSINSELTKEDWHETQISFLQSHHYFTRFYQEEKEPVKQNYLLHLLQQ